MEILLLGIYSFFVWLIFIKFKWLPWNTATQVTVAIIPIVALTALILALNVFAPSSADVRVFRFTVPIVSQVRGRVVEVPIEEGNVPVKKGDVLFRIGPTPYQLQVNTLRAQLENAGAQERELQESLKGAQAKIAEARVARGSDAKKGEPRARAEHPECRQEGDQESVEGEEEDPAPLDPARQSYSTAISGDGGPAPAEFRSGQRCEIISVHHPVFSSEIGRKIITTKVFADTRQGWAHHDGPARCRINRNGRRITDYDPRCIQSIYRVEQLRGLNRPGRTREHGPPEHPP